MTADECRTLKDYAVSSFAEKSEKLKYKQKFEQADKNAKIWKDRFEKLNKDYEELKQKAQPFLDAIEIASERSGLLSMPSSPGERNCMNTNTLPAIVDRTWKFKKGTICL